MYGNAPSSPESSVHVALEYRLIERALLRSEQVHRALGVPEFGLRRCLDDALDRDGHTLVGQRGEHLLGQHHRDAAPRLRLLVFAGNDPVHAARPYLLLERVRASAAAARFSPTMAFGEGSSSAPKPCPDFGSTSWSRSSTAPWRAFPPVLMWQLVAGCGPRWPGGSSLCVRAATATESAADQLSHRRLRLYCVYNAYLWRRGRLPLTLEKL